MNPAVEASHLGVEILNAARRWVKARGDLRRVLDSKKATPEVLEAAKAAYNRTAEELERHVLTLERLMNLNGIAVSMRKRKKPSEPFPLQNFLHAVAAGAKALEAAVNARSGSGSSADASKQERLIIDVEPQ